MSTAGAPSQIGSTWPPTRTLPAADPGSRRPLFLGSQLRARVDTDGPALRVRAAQRAETRFPLDSDRTSAAYRWRGSSLYGCQMLMFVWSSFGIQQIDYNKKVASRLKVASYLHWPRTASTPLARSRRRRCALSSCAVVRGRRPSVQQYWTTARAT
jgi:hypothetical protein